VGGGSGNCTAFGSGLNISGDAGGALVLMT
jgi:hypothetical protein